MPETKHILILANSVRSKKHCVAGKVATPLSGSDYDIGKEWIRLTDPRVPDGAVPYTNTICPGKGSVYPLQLIKVELQGSCNDANHPEDWNFEPTKTWEWVSSMTVETLPIVAIGFQLVDVRRGGGDETERAIPKKEPLQDLAPCGACHPIRGGIRSLAAILE